MGEYTSREIHKSTSTHVGVYTSRRIHTSAYTQVMLSRTRLMRTQFIGFVQGPEVPLKRALPLYPKMYHQCLGP